MSLGRESVCARNVILGTCGYSSILNMIREGNIEIGNDVAVMAGDVARVEIITNNISSNVVMLSPEYRDGATMGVFACRTCGNQVLVRPDLNGTLSTETRDLDSIWY